MGIVIVLFPTSATRASSFSSSTMHSLSLSIPLTPRSNNTSSRSKLLVSSQSQLCTQKTLIIDKSALIVKEAVTESELWAAASLRIRSFNHFSDSFRIEEHKNYLVEREFVALKERIAGQREGFRRVSCINACFPISQVIGSSGDLCAKCKFTEDGEEQVVVGSLDLNQCMRLPDEITGMKPLGIGADFARAYLSNVCVAKELHRNGLGYELILKAKTVAEEWGISDLYVHVAVNNEPAKNLYLKSGFIPESDESAQEARFLNRPRRILLWTGLSNPYNL